MDCHDCDEIFSKNGEKPRRFPNYRVGCVLPLQESNKGRRRIVSVSSCCPSNGKFRTRLNKNTENNMIYTYGKGKDEHF